MALEPPAAADDADPPVSTDVWLACAVPMSRLPAIGSEVYYFPHGHAEQCPEPLPSTLPRPHIFPCTVTALRLAADTKTDEVMAHVSLQPGPHGSYSAPAAAAADPAFRFYGKLLTQSDANNGGGFSVPRYCADLIFPKLNFDDEPPVQTLLVRDLAGNPWQFRHIYRGTPRRHLLTTGWSKFVNAKLLVAGDTIVFMRRPDGELLVGMRRAPRYPFVREGPGRDIDTRARVPPERVIEAARLATEGKPFTVTYYPRLGAGEFVVPRQEVEDALTIDWEPGMQVRMQAMEGEDARRIIWANGTVKELRAQMWRPLEVEWDDSSPSMKRRHLNAWQLQFVGYAPLFKRLRSHDTLLDSGVDSTMVAPLLLTKEMGLLPTPPPPAAAAAAGMQEARHNGPTDHPSSARITAQLLFPSPVEDLSGASEILDPELGSPPSNSATDMAPSTDLPAVETRKSIQLFGVTITPHALPSAADASSEEVNNEVADDRVVDENAEQDA